ncbi:P-loop ATPase, Sll1717 family [Thalassococcus sp. BH17M4-6]|uniref:P-loop ATPase, Sll1717 family n=1 Tax=Thalassococcus sp. BH17M4-6 TaxID=3413148 RepID=UPI003BBEA391
MKHDVVGNARRLSDMTIERLLRLTDFEIDTLRNHFNHRTPFGPENAGVVRDADAKWLIFSTQNELCKAYRKSPRIIIGRRGSGKTSIVSNTDELVEHDVTLLIDTADAIEYVRDAIFEDVAPSDVYVEKVEKFWTYVLDALLMRQIVKNYGELRFPNCSKFLSTFSIGDDAGFNDIVSSFRKSVDRLGDGLGTFFVRAFFEYIDTGEAGYASAIQELETFSSEKNFSSVAIIDSIEDYKIGNEKNAASIQGLLKAVGEYGNRQRQVRLCIPGEAYFEIKNLSSNFSKDLSDSLILHWLPSELMHIMAWRYLIFLRIYSPEDLSKFSDLDIKSRSHVSKVLQNFLPQTIKNSFGKSESSLAYILRHTQLLPRQLILILNSIFRTNTGEHISSYRDINVVMGLRSCESFICDEVFSAFRYKFPFAEDLCKKVIVHLPRTFRDGDLHRVYSRFGSAVLREYGAFDFHDFKEILVEIGAIGRVKNITGMYAEAEFEYAMPGRLHLATDDQLCLHPVFSGVFEASAHRTDEVFVYPQRDWFENEEQRSVWLKV